MASKETCKECGKVTLRISWSSLKVHEECKQKGYRMRQGKRFKSEDQRNFFPGTVVDRISRDFLDNEPHKHKGEMPDMVRDYIEREQARIEEEGLKLKWRNQTDKDDVIKTCVEAATKLEPLLEKFILPYDFQPAYRFKAPFTVPGPDETKLDVLLNGEMDYIVRDSKGRYAIWDLKITRDNSYWKKTLGQLVFYDFANKVMTDEYTVVTGLLQPLCNQPYKSFKLTEDQRTKLMSSVVGMANDIAKEDFTPRKDNTICWSCPVKHACTKFSPKSFEGKKTLSFS